MIVGWLMDDPGYVGGAELTAKEFRDAAPDHVEVVDCPAGGVVPGLGRYVIHNCTSYEALGNYAPMAGAPKCRYHHDLVRAPMDTYLDDHARPIFCSPLQREHWDAYDNTSLLIPPAIDLSRYTANGEREGSVWLGRFWAEKGIDLAMEYAKLNGGIDFYGDGPEPPPERPYARIHDAVPYEQVPEVLAKYERFVHLPKAIEPFGRSVVEAWASGLELVVNSNVGALHWIENEPEKLESAAEDFWECVLR